jgi:general secretion pathway protein J
MFAYAGTDGTWQPTWHAPTQLPARIRIIVRDGVTQQKMAVSTAALVHIDMPASCVREKDVNQCLAQIAQAPAGGNQTPAHAAPD